MLNKIIEKNQVRQCFHKFDSLNSLGSLLTTHQAMHTVLIYTTRRLIITFKALHNLAPTYIQKTCFSKAFNQVLPQRQQL